MFLSALDQTISGSPNIHNLSKLKLISGNTVTTAIPAIAEQFDSPTTYTWIGSSLVLQFWHSERSDEGGA